MADRFVAAAADLFDADEARALSLAEAVVRSEPDFLVGSYIVGGAPARPALLGLLAHRRRRLVAAMTPRVDFTRVPA